MNTRHVSASRWHPTAAVAAWVLPGLGHFMLGQRRRGIILFIAITLLWSGGLLIGGLSSIDREAHRAWFLGQMLTAPSILVDQIIQLDRDTGSVTFEPNFGRMNEMGVLFTALAGMLNLLLIIDVAYRDPADPRYQPEDAVEGKGGWS